MDNLIPEEIAYSEAQRMTWMTSTVDGPPSISLPSAGPTRRNWQEFMAFDGRSPTELSSNGSTQAPHDMSAYMPTGHNVGPKSQFVVSSVPSSYSVQPTTITPVQYAFGQDQIAQSYPFSPGIGGQVSPFSEYSRHNSVDTSVWNGKRVPMAPPMSKVGSSFNNQNATISPRSNESSPVEESFQRPSNGASPNSHHTPSPPQSNHNPIPKKRKVHDDDEISENMDDDRPGGKKTAHNMIEKRYRNNLNDKIAALRDAVPSLRIVCRNVSDGDDNDREDLEGLAPAHKLNKATVLSKATEYIRHLEKQKLRQEHEISELRTRLTNYERMIKAGRQVFHSPVSTPDRVFMQEEMYVTSPAVASSSQAPPNGMIPIPESLANMRVAQLSQAPYNTPHMSYPIYPPDSSAEEAATGRRHTTGPRGGMVGRVMIGGLTTLMLLDGIWEEEQKGNEVEARGLFSLPIPLGSFKSLGSRSSLNGAMFPDMFSVVRLALLFASIAYVIAPMFDFKAQSKKKFTHGLVKTNYSLASPVEFRQKAWLTAIQTVWVPNHIFLLEVAALCLKIIKLSTRKLIGWDGYALLTGFTKDQEIARVKAWNIALDAQLTGGDAEISISRLILTLLASSTLPSTPARLMLKALHIRVLLWEAANAGYGSWFMLDELSVKLARTYWNAARSEHQARVNCPEFTPTDDDYSLPEHLSKLLELDSDNVLVDAVVQRVYNLAWNRPTAENIEEDAAMDSVVEDLHIASPLDALAAWWSTLVLNRIVSHTIETSNRDESVLLNDLDLALQVAPPPSSARIRALVAKALLVKEERYAHIQSALDSLPPFSSSKESGSSSPTPACINFVGDAPVPTDVISTLTIAKCLALAEESTYQAHLMATSFINRYLPLPASFSLLSFAASLQLLEHCINTPVLSNDAQLGLERLSSGLRVFVGSSAGLKLHLGDEARAQAVERCLSASRLIMGVGELTTDVDQGYASQSDNEDDGPIKEPSSSASTYDSSLSCSIV